MLPVSPVLSAMLVPVPPLPSDGDARLDRAGTHSRKLQGRSGEYEGRDVVPLWVADMCLSAPQPIVDAIVARAQHGVYGYTDCPAALTAAMLTHLEGYYGCRHPEATWFRWLPGLLPGLNHAVRASCTPGSGDAVAVATPIYPPFLDTAAICGAVLVRVPLAEVRLGESALRYR
jgi:cystathionine beta-lyase|tara:strand:+ start:22 stop:543 length:522 start_codon:yes stop_codon:yes gene_type:complete